MANRVQYEVGVYLPTRMLAGVLLRSLLAKRGFDLAGLVEQTDKKGTKYSFYLHGRKEADAVSRRLRALRLRHAHIFIKRHLEADWASRWKKGWRPFALTRRFYVIPLWQARRRIPAGREPIFLETTNAFGTGLHETTRLVAEFIESREGKFESFLDVGTGTGILTIVALRCGSRRAVAFDIDPVAVRVARDNLQANRLSCRVAVADVARYHVRSRFDLVAANLVSPDLIAWKDRIIALVRPGGTLVVSGISMQNIGKVKKAFVSPAVRLDGIFHGQEWAAISFEVGAEGDR